MDEWLKQNWFFAGSVILCAIGLAFALGAIVEAKFTLAKRWWIAFWMGLLGFYFFGLLFPSLKIQNVFALGIPALFNGISTLAIVALWLESRNHRSTSTRALTTMGLIAGVSAFALALGTYANNRALGFIPEVVSWFFFLLLAWNYRTRHMTTTVLLLAYANLQLPAGLFGKQGWGVDPVALLAAKLSLIAAMYKMLGIRDAPD